MKNLLILFAVTGIAFFTSCEKQLDSINGTHWVNDDYFSDGSLISELRFSSETITFTLTNVNQDYSSTRTGTYTYDPPSIFINVEGIHSEEPGTIKGDILTIGITAGDIIVPLQFTKQ